MTVVITRYDSEIIRYIPQAVWPNLSLILANGTTQLANANGYTTGGRALTNVRYSYAGGVVTVKADDVSWRATGGSLSADTAYLRFGSIDLVKIDFGATLSAPANTALVVQWHTDGLFNFSML
jgi:hypothetical protein